jgi:hypothetical protein
MKLYFAYGSNLSREQMKGRCPDNKLLGGVVLHDHRWFIYKRGFANIEKSTKDYVEGLLYLISDSDEESLDVCEGVSIGLYQKKYVEVVHKGKLQRKVLVYIAPETEEGTPQPDYARVINEGIADAQLSKEYVMRYIRPFISAK